MTRPDIEGIEGVIANSPYVIDSQRVIKQLLAHVKELEVENSQLLGQVIELTAALQRNGLDNDD